MSEPEAFCSLCMEPVEDDAVAILEHLLDEHAYEEDFFEFIADIEFGVHCGRCRRWFHTSVEPTQHGTFRLRHAACPDCRTGAWERIRGEFVEPRDLVKRGRRAAEGVA